MAIDEFIKAVSPKTKPFELPWLSNGFNRAPEHVKQSSVIIPTAESKLSGQYLFHQSEEQKIATNLKELHFRLFQPINSDAVIAARNLDSLKDVTPIKMNFESSKVDNHMFWEMKRLAGQSYGSAYISSRTPENIVWLAMTKEVGLNYMELQILKKAYAKHFRLNLFDLDAISTWTDKNQFLVSDELSDALKRIKPFEGIVIRNSVLDEASEKALMTSYKKGKPLAMTSIVKNTPIHKKATGVLDAIMATTPAGNALFNAVSHSSRLVIYSRNGRFVAPLSIHHGEMEVMLHSKLSEKGFKVLGQGTTEGAHGRPVKVWFLDELV